MYIIHSLVSTCLNLVFNKYSYAVCVDYALSALIMHKRDVP